MHNRAGTTQCASGIAGLDEILMGGFPSDRVYLVQGNPGVGKTTLAMQFLLEGVKKGETGLYITLSETKEELELVAASHGWDLSGINMFELSAVEEKLRDGSESTFFHPSEVELNKTAEALLEEVRRVKPARCVFDSLSEMRLLAETPLRYRRQILELKDFFAGRKCTTLLLDDLSGGSRDLQIESLAHGVISMNRLAPEYGNYRRQLTVQKIRGVRFCEGNHDFIINRGGLSVFPRLVAQGQVRDFEPESFPSGNTQLDKLLGGGLDRGTSTMLIGPAGTNKSTIAIQFAIAAAARNEKVLYFTFDETLGILTNRARNLGMEMRPHIESGVIELTQIDPAELSPGELVDRIRHSVMSGGVRMVVIDSINGYLNAMPAERYLNLQLHELLAFLNQQGIISIIILGQHGLVGTMQTNVDLTYLADTVVLLRYFESQGAVKQALSILKKRSGNHERMIREIWVNQEGLHIGEPLRDMQGVLSGTPTFIKRKRAA